MTTNTKNYLALFIALFITADFLRAQNLLLPLLKDSSRYHTYDFFTGELQDNYNSYFKYNNDNLLSEELSANIFAGNDPLYYKHHLEYNPEKLLSSSATLKSSVSITGPWENSHRLEVTYDDKGRKLLNVQQIANTSGGWDSNYREIFVYDDAAHVDSLSIEYWDADVPGWETSARIFNTYTPAGALQRKDIYLRDGQSSTLNHLYILEYTYFPDGKVRTYREIANHPGSPYIRLDSLIYRLDGLLDSTFTRTDYLSSNSSSTSVTKSEYDSEGRLILNTTFSRYNDETLWQPSYQQSFVPGDGIYSSNPRLETYSIFNVWADSFELSQKIIREFTPLGNDVVFYKEEYIGINAQGVLTTETVDSVWYHLATVGTNTALASAKADCQFANPFSSGNCIVCQSSDESSPLTIQVSNVSGQLLAQARVMPGDSWRPSAGLQAGLYFVTIWQNGQYLGQRKMVVK